MRPAGNPRQPARSRVLAPLGLALLVLTTAPLAAEALPMLAGATGVGSGHYVHTSASGTFQCPRMVASFQHAFVTATLSFQAAGASKVFGMTVADFVNHVSPCTLGTSTAFGITDFAGNPERGYEARRVTDHTQLAGITTEHLSISSLRQAPVRVQYWAQTVGGPAPSTWWFDGVMSRTVDA